MTALTQALLSADRARLHAHLLEGHAVDPGALDNTRYRGTSLGLPGWVDRLAWKTFQKSFHLDPRSGHLRGWNTRLVQEGIGAPPTPQTKAGEPLHFGHFVVTTPENGPGPAAGLLLDYGQGDAPSWSPMAALRDPIVALHPGDPTVLLGWSYLAFGTVHVPTPSYFLLELAGPLQEPVPLTTSG